ncbi:hypothetical protein DPMN_082465 [Dreissena polymorpha]|uniref:Uncharacterized protein n=1 Tax=Dreissena polymorpha TaxID=45954 RepID=A0A9D4BHC0_DREPO|nr:hypothetical protein DPMN_082465 [Dreissena polymorpha]
MAASGMVRVAAVYGPESAAVCIGCPCASLTVREQISDRTIKDHDGNYTVVPRPFAAVARHTPV